MLMLPNNACANCTSIVFLIGNWILWVCIKNRLNLNVVYVCLFDLSMKNIHSVNSPHMHRGFSLRFRIINACRRVLQRAHVLPSSLSEIAKPLLCHYLWIDPDFSTYTFTCTMTAGGRMTFDSKQYRFTKHYWWCCFSLAMIYNNGTFVASANLVNTSKIKHNLLYVEN